MKKISFETEKPNDWRKKNRVQLNGDQKNIVESLEKMLADAKSGKINKMIAVSEVEQDQYALVYRGATYQEALNMTHTLMDYMFEQWYREEE
ncbi:hypothetical protein [Bacillus altitudinis]|uniref:hypothetical protein n=1 Tax=Bacillus altitudinis TaxID=293387 RepID=UPI0024ADA94C|nr:hypothetical protein [Bacillus altitudinis]MDI4570438.1 hypothetical protein [Bacillus altitudinis]